VLGSDGESASRRERLLGDPTPLAYALVKIDDAARRRPMDVPPAQTGQCIVNPLTGRRARFARLFMTHPPTEQRVARLLGNRNPIQ
jgi:heat shock protein HtpX